jgi:glycosyltransferase involved in cell wall biosynthesis
MQASRRRASIHKRTLVSIICITYNHEQYIAQALDNFLSQKHDNFDLEVIVADDASEDRTQQIISKYASAFPQTIQPILQEKNVGIQNNLFDALNRAKGQYIALCEGDDYWINDEKLSMQLSYMEAHHDTTVCFHPVKVLYEGVTKVASAPEIFPERVFRHSPTRMRLLATNYIQTNSVMYRRLATYHQPDSTILPLDWYLNILHATTGEVACVSPDVPLSVYRRHAGGVWWQSSGEEMVFWKKQAIPHLRMFREVAKLVEADPKELALLEVTELRTLGDVITVCLREGDVSLLDRIIDEVPDRLTAYLSGQQGTINALRIEIGQLKQKYSNESKMLKKNNKDLRAEVERLRSEATGLHRQLRNPIAFYGKHAIGKLKEH